MKLWLNDEVVELQEGLSLAQALSNWTDIRGTFAVALNNDFVAQGAYDTTLLKEGDQLYIVTPMQGG